MTLLGYHPKVSLEAGISRTIPWYREHRAGLTA
jgi:nucleoside-diphosphate-sugar epimerase